MHRELRMIGVGMPVVKILTSNNLNSKIEYQTRRQKVLTQKSGSTCGDRATSFIED